MKRLTLAKLRSEAWKVLTKQTDVIYVIRADHKDRNSAHCLYDEKTITIYVDTMTVRIDHAVIHEIMHKLLDEHLEPTFAYHVYELFIQSLEAWFFKPMTHKQIKKWHDAIDKLTVIKRR